MRPSYFSAFAFTRSAFALLSALLASGAVRQRFLRWRWPARGFGRTRSGPSGHERRGRERRQLAVQRRRGRNDRRRERWRVGERRSIEPWRGRGCCRHGRRQRGRKCKVPPRASVRAQLLRRRVSWVDASVRGPESM